jgi:hypothetical protein
MKPLTQPIRLALAGLAAMLLALGAHAQSPEGQTYAPGPFDRLELAGSANVKLSQGERDAVFIAGNAEVQKGVEVDLSNERLRIRPTGSWKFWNSARLQIDVVMRKISHLVLSGATDLHAAGPIKADKLAITISGAGLARFDDLTADMLHFGVSGAGDGQLRGQVNDLALQVSGKGKLLAENLHAQRASVSISGIGSANVWVSDELRIQVSGIGSVDYWGQPNVKRGSSGMSTVNARGDKPWPPLNQSSPSQ